MLLAACVAATRLFFSNLRVENEKKNLLTQIGDLTGKIAEMTEREVSAIKNQEAQTERHDADLEKPVLHKGIRFRRTNETGGKWAAFCTKCGLPAIGAQRRASRIVMCSGRCGWEVFDRDGIPALIKEVEDSHAA